MDTRTLEEAIQQQIAAQLISTLPDEQKNEIIARAIQRILTTDLHIKWDVEKLLKGYALHYAAEYVAAPEIQQRLKDVARRVVDDVMTGIIKVIGKEIEDGVKSRYQRFLSSPPYCGD